jgi:hypothetical protein
MKITRKTEEENDSIEYIQIKTAGIDSDYAIINDGEGDEYWEILPGKFHHSFLKEDDTWFNGTENIKHVEILTENLVCIAKI